MESAQRAVNDDRLATLLQLLKGNPLDPQCHLNLGVHLARQRRHDEALIHLREATKLDPGYQVGWRNLALCLQRSGNWGEAATAYEMLCRLRPEDPQAHLAAGVAIRRADQPGAALYHLQRATKLTPANPGAWHALASAQADLGHYREAKEAFAKAAEADPASSHVASDVVHLLHYDPQVTSQQSLDAARAWARKHAEHLTASNKRRVRVPTISHRLRIGFVSCDFRDHPVGRLTPPILTHLDRSKFDIVCYDDSRSPDQVTKRLMALPQIIWRQTHKLGDQAMADLIRQDHIDVLVDLSGHMGGHRLSVFARKPAPVQVTHFNYPDTTGMTAMDYRISDTLAEPEGSTDGYSTERLLRLPQCAWCYDPGLGVPDVGPLPALKNGFITFTSLNKPLKHSEPTAALWASVLTAVPGSRLMLLGLANERENVLLYEWFARHGMRREQILFVVRRPRNQYMDLYNQADIALDPFPYNGGITSCDGLYMGVPLVALEGSTYHSRQGLMLLTNLGLPELVAKTPNDYGQIALQMANDLPRLADLRQSLRQRMLSSSLMDGTRFAKRLGDAFSRIAAEVSRNDSQSG